MTEELVLACREIPARVTVTGRVHATEEDFDTFFLINWQIIQDGPPCPHLSIQAVMGITTPSCHAMHIAPSPGSFVTLTGELLSFEDDALVVAVNEVIDLGTPAPLPVRRHPPLQGPFRYTRKGKSGRRSSRNAKSL